MDSQQPQLEQSTTGIDELAYVLWWEWEKRKLVCVASLARRRSPWSRTRICLTIEDELTRFAPIAPTRSSTRYRRALERRHIFGAGLAAEETAHPRWLGAGRIADPVRRTFSICSV